MLDVINLNFDYTDKPLLQNVQFQVEAGQLLHLQGDNGAGKTTLLKLLAGLLQPALGEIRYQGQDIRDHLAEYQQSLCYVGHKTGVSHVLTVRENCQFDLQRGKHCMPFEALISRFSLKGLEDVPCGLLSAGQQRRVGLLRILMSDALLWLLDEPLVALDQDAAMILMDCFAEHLDKGGMIVLTSHQALPEFDRNCRDYRLC
jgi:heme exporter protein A